MNSNFEAGFEKLAFFFKKKKRKVEVPTITEAMRKSVRSFRYKTPKHREIALSKINSHAKAIGHASRVGPSYSDWAINNHIQVMGL